MELDDTNQVHARPKLIQVVPVGAVDQSAKQILVQRYVASVLAVHYALNSVEQAFGVYR